MAPSTFGERFGYAGWLYHLREGRAPAFAAIGRAVGRTGEAVAGWAGAKEPPPFFQVHTPLAAFLGVNEAWLIKNQGDAPEPELWATWLRTRRSKSRKTVRETNERAVPNPATSPGSRHVVPKGS